VAVAAIKGSGFPESKVSLSSGVAWLNSPGRALVTLMDGPSGQVIGNIRAAAGVRDVVQVGESAVLVDPAAGTLTRVDGGTFAVSPPVRFATTGSIGVLAGRSAVYVIGEKQIDVLDPVTLAVRQQVALDARPSKGQAVVDGDDRLWAVEGASGGLVGIGGTGDALRSTAAGPGAQLVVAQGRAIVADVAGRRAGVVGDDGGVSSWSCLSAGASGAAESLRLLGAVDAARVYAVDAAAGTLSVSDVDSDRCGKPVAIGKPGDSLGRVVESSGFVLVPDETTGHASVVDPASSELIGDVPVLPAPVGKLELLGRNGLVFYNDLAGNRAGVLNLADRKWAVGTSAVKFSEGSGSAADDPPLLEPADDPIPPSQDLKGTPPRANRPGPNQVPAAPRAPVPPPVVPPPVVPPPVVPPPVVPPAPVVTTTPVEPPVSTTPDTVGPGPDTLPPSVVVEPPKPPVTTAAPRPPTGQQGGQPAPIPTPPRVVAPAPPAQSGPASGAPG
jgi:hypothetical protein